MMPVLVRAFCRSIFGILLALSAGSALFAQEAKQTLASVPFIGCKSDGQIGRLDAPAPMQINLPLSPSLTHALAFYKSAKGVGVLAPRGWHCFGTYGSGGNTLFVSQDQADTRGMSSLRDGLRGPAIEVSYRDGETSGRDDVAAAIARVFPDHKSFVTGLIEMFDMPPDSFPFGPYPNDTLRYKSRTVVEYQTPAQKEGLGTYSLLKKNDAPIDGGVILFGDTPDLLRVSVRLPTRLKWLTPAILEQFEREAEHPSN